jgi:hypothetical protein
MASRTHIVLPEEMIEEIDRIAGKRKRSQFIEEAVRERLIIERQRTAVRAAAGILKPDDYPEWSTPEKTSEWVHRMRRQDDEIVQRKIARHDERPG